MRAENSVVLGVGALLFLSVLAQFVRRVIAPTLAAARDARARAPTEFEIAEEDEDAAARPPAGLDAAKLGQCTRLRKLGAASFRGLVDPAEPNCSGDTERGSDAGSEAYDADLSCAICLEPFVPEDSVRVLPCDHMFHAANCVDDWLRKSDRCPLCKQSVLEIASASSTPCHSPPPSPRSEMSESAAVGPGMV